MYEIRYSIVDTLRRTNVMKKYHKRIIELEHELTSKDITTHTTLAQRWSVVFGYLVDIRSKVK